MSEHERAAKDEILTPTDPSGHLPQMPVNHHMKQSAAPGIWGRKGGGVTLTPNDRVTQGEEHRMALRVQLVADERARQAAEARLDREPE